MDLTLQRIRETHKKIESYLFRTPVAQFELPHVAKILGDPQRVFFKLELFQHAGSFKPRGALAVMLELSAEQLARGVTAVSGGNHAMAVGYAAARLGTTAKVVMPKTASPARVSGCKRYGATVELVDSIHQAFERVQEIQAGEGRALVHPFEGEHTSLGTATLGLELLEQVPDLDAVVIPIGGGGLCSGMAAAIKQLNPSCAVYGVEPEGADSMFCSFQSGRPEKLEAVNTIADSLGAPYALPFSFGLCKRYVDQVVRVTDDELRRAMALLFYDAKLVAEPAAAAATAALLGPLRETLRSKRVGVVVCGANIDPESYCQHVRRGEELLVGI